MKNYLIIHVIIKGSQLGQKSEFLGFYSMVLFFFPLYSRVSCGNPINSFQINMFQIQIYTGGQKWANIKFRENKIKSCFACKQITNCYSYFSDNWYC